MTTRYGWRRQLPDFRDFKYSASLRTLMTLPPLVDLRRFMPRVYDQTSLGSCTANGIGGGHQYGQIKQLLSPTGAADAVAIETAISQSFVPSRLFIYYNERVMEGSVNEDAGAIIRDGMKSVANEGVCDERMWPYDVNKFKNKPTDECYKEALEHQVISYHAVNQTIDQLKGCLAEGYPFVFGFSVYESFESPAVAKTGIMVMPGRDESLLGGHAVIAVGYDDSKRWFIIRNSWGEGWGECFTGDTKVRLLSGEAKSLKELSETYADKSFWVYSYDTQKQEIVPGLARCPRKTKTNAEIVKIRLDSGEEIRCTPTHPFLLKDGTYKEAAKLTVEDSLMPLYTKKDKGGYEMFVSPKSTKYIRSHWCVARNSGKFVGKEGSLVVHHKDFNKTNNTPENLEVMSVREHHDLHRELGVRNGRRVMLHLWGDRREEMLASSVKSITAYNDDLASGVVSLTSKQLEARRANGDVVGRLYQERVRNGEVGITEKQVLARRANGAKLGKLPKTETQKSKAGDMCAKLAQYRWYKKEVSSPVGFNEWRGVCNHKIVSIEKCGREDVYDITVDKYHNFALDSGVFVHNCGYFYMPYDYITNRGLADDFWTIRLVEDEDGPTPEPPEPPKPEPPEPTPPTPQPCDCSLAFPMAKQFLDAAVAEINRGVSTEVAIAEGLKAAQLYVGRVQQVRDRSR